MNNLFTHVHPGSKSLHLLRKVDKGITKIPIATYVDMEARILIYHLVNVMFLYGEVKHGVEIIEEIHHFHRGTLGGQAGKAHYVREVDCHRLV